MVLMRHILLLNKELYMSGEDEYLQRIALRNTKNILGLIVPLNWRILDIDIRAMIFKIYFIYFMTFFRWSHHSANKGILI